MRKRQLNYFIISILFLLFSSFDHPALRMLSDSGMNTTEEGGDFGATASFEGDPASSGTHNVSVVSGRYSDESVDFVMQEHRSLFWRRSSADTMPFEDRFLGKKFVVHGGMNPHYYVFCNVIKEKHYCNHAIVVLADTFGSSLPYDGRGEYLPWVHPILAEHVIDKAFTNTAGGEISGRTNLKNVKFRNWEQVKEQMQVTFGDGTKRIYSKGKKEERKEKPGSTFRTASYNYTRVLEQEETPDGRLLVLTHDSETNLIEQVKACGKASGRVFGSFKIVDRVPGDPSFKIETSDGRSYTYKYKKLVETPFYDKETMKKIQDHFVLISAEGSDLPKVEYTYRESGGHGLEVVSKTVEGEARWEFEFCQKGDPVCFGGRVRDKYTGLGRVRTEKGPAGPDATPVTLYSFSYNLRRHKKGEGKTYVRDALGNETVHSYGEKLRLEESTYYDSNKKCLGSIKMGWDQIKGPRCGNLVRKRWYEGDAQGLVLEKRFEYDAAGNVLQESTFGQYTGKATCREKEGWSEARRMRYTYSKDGFNLLLTSTDDRGVVTTLSYRPGTELVTAKLLSFEGKIFQRFFFEYDEDGLLTQKSLDDGCSEDASNFEGVTERKIQRLTVVEAGHGLGKVSTRHDCYWENGVEHPLRTIRYGYDENGRCVKEAFYDANDLFCYELTRKFDANGRLVMEEDQAKNRTEYAYDKFGNVTEVWGPIPGLYTKNSYDLSQRLVSRVTYYPDGTVDTESNSWDYLGHLIAKEDLLGNVTSYEYDGLGRASKEILPALEMMDGSLLTPFSEKEQNFLGACVSERDLNGFVTKKRLTSDGKPLEVIYGDGTRESFVYTLLGDCEKAIHKDGSYTTYQYDHQGRVLQESFYTAAGQFLYTTSHRYSTFQKIATVDALGVETRFSYDGAGRLTESISGSKHEQYFYDALGDQAIVRKWYGDGPTDFTETHFKKNFLGKVVEEKVVDGTGKLCQLSTFVYDSFKNCLQTVQWHQENAPAVTQTFYDARHRPIKTVDPLGQVTLISYEKVRNGIGQWVVEKKEVGPTGLQTITRYDAHQNVSLVTRKDASGRLLAETRFFYDGNKNKVGQIDSVIVNGEVKRQLAHRWTVGWEKRLEKEERSLGTPQEQSTLYHYDAIGRISLKTLPNGVRLHHEYDEVGRLARIFSEGHEHPIDYRYTYDLAGNLLLSEDMLSGDIWRRSYDQEGRILTEQCAEGWYAQFTYDSGGRRTSATWEEEHRVEYLYSGPHFAGIHAVAEGQDFTYEYLERTLQGRCIKARALGQELLFPKDVTGRSLGTETPFWSQVITPEDYHPLGMLIKSQIYDHQGSYCQTFEYDALQHLVKEEGHESHQFAFDSIHNRIEADGFEEEVNAANQLTKDRFHHYIYDANGNLVHKEGAEGVTRYTYDALDRLIAIEQPQQWRLTMGYDSDHRRLFKTSWRWYNGGWLETSTQNYIWDGKNEIGAIVDRKITEWRVLGDGMGSETDASVGLWLNQRWYLPIHDHRGSIVTIVDAQTHQVQESYRHTAFGLEDTSQPPLNPWRLSAKRVDEESGLVYFGRRFYSPTTARWITADPAGFVDGANVYAYVLGNPISYFDPHGLFTSFLKRYWKPLSLVVNVGMIVWSGGFSSHLTAFNFLLDTCEQVGLHTGLHPFMGAVRLLRGNFSLPEFAKEGTQAFTIGSVTDPHYSLTTTNGVCTTYSTAKDTCETLFNWFKSPITMIYNSTRGLLFDLVECSMNKAGIATKSAKLLVQTWREILAEQDKVGGGYIFHLAHSQGGLTTALALAELTPEERNRILVYTFGSARMIPASMGYEVINYVSSRDIVPATDVFGYLEGRMNPGGAINMRVLESNGFPLCDHAFLGDTYQQGILEVARIWENRENELPQYWK